MMTDRKWWPEHVLDEVLPAGRDSPTAWLSMKGQAIEMRDDDMPEWTGHVTAGEIVDFHYCDDCGRAVVQFRRDGTYRARSPIPGGWSHLRPAGPCDPDVLAYSLAELAGQLADRLDADSEEIAVTFYYWSDAQPHRIDIVDGKPIAVPVATGHA